MNDKMHSDKMIETAWGLRFPIGFKYIDNRSKRKDEHTVVDYRLIFNLNMELVTFRYVTKHTFMGQDIINSEVLENTIQRNLR